MSTFSSDPRNWLDAPRTDPPSAVPAAAPPTVETAVDALAVAIAEAQGDASCRVATYLGKDPGKSSFEGIAAQLTEPGLLVFMERMSAANPRTSGLITSLFRSENGVVRPTFSLDGLARGQLMRRMLDEARLAALARACAPAAHSGDPA